MKGKKLFRHIRRSQLRRIFLPLLWFGASFALFLAVAVPAALLDQVNNFGMQMLCLLILLSLLLSAGLLGYMLLILAFPALTPAIRLLFRYGNEEEILDAAEKELNGEHIVDTGNKILTPKYLFRFIGDKSAVIPLQSVLWVFPYENLRFSLRRRKQVMRYYLRIVTITGDAFTLATENRSNIDAFMHVLTERYPNFFYGYSEEHERMVRYILEESRREQHDKRKNH